MLPENAIFMHNDVKELLRNKTVVVLGDSIQRSVYKDLVCLWKQSNSRYLHENELRRKGEKEFLGDCLLVGGQQSTKNISSGVEYREVREFKEGQTVFRFYFVTRCYNDYVESVINEMKSLNPHVLIMNSCYWDIHRYGEQAKNQYEPNLEKLLTASWELPSKPLFIWSSALPLAKYCKGGFLRQGFKTLPLGDVVAANKIAREVVNRLKGVYLDLFNTLPQNSIFEQASDGIHWGHRAHRKMSNSILTVISSNWGKPIPTLKNDTPVDRDYLAQEMNPWPYYPEDSFEEYDGEEYYDEGFDFWENHYEPAWDMGFPHSSYFPPPPFRDGLLPTPNFQFNYPLPPPWHRAQTISPNDRYLEWTEPSPLMSMTPGNNRRKNINRHQRHFSDPLPRYLPNYGIGLLNEPQFTTQYHAPPAYRNRFKDNIQTRKKQRLAKSSSTAAISLARQQATSTPKPLTVSHTDTGASPVLKPSTSDINAEPMPQSVSEPQATDTNNNIDTKTSDTCSELLLRNGTDSSDREKASNSSELPIGELPVGGRKRKRDDIDETDEKASENYQPVKQARQEIDCSVKCTLFYDALL